MSAMEREQLELLKRQLEEEYRLDMAAIDRLLRRFAGQNGTPRSASQLPAPSSFAGSESLGNLTPAFEPQPAAAQDDLTSSLRTMFSTVRK